MTIKINAKADIQGMRKAGRLASRLLDYITPFVKAGVSTMELNTMCETWTREHNAVSAPLGYKTAGISTPFPGSICTSINDVVCHGIPSKDEVLHDGDIVNIDVTVKLNGYHGDTSRTFTVGEVPQEVGLLVARTKTAMERGIGVIKPGAHFGDIGKAIEQYVNKFGYGIITSFGGHGINTIFHDEPFIAHYDTGAKGPVMKAGMIFTVEPMLTLGGDDAMMDDDEWTARTEDGSLTAQFEHTVLVTESGFELLTVSA